MYQSPGVTELSRISVVIPNFNGASTLPHCLQSLRAEESERFRFHEIIVVDDGSTDDSENVAKPFGVTYLRLTERGGPSRARNYGARTATGDLIWFLDADIEVRDGAAEIIDNAFADPTLDALIGSYDDDPSDPGLVSRFKNLFHHFVHQQAHGSISSFWSGCGVVRKNVFDGVGGYEEKFWHRYDPVEDIHFGYKLQTHGCNIRLNRNLQVKHHKRWTLSSLFMADVFNRAIPWTIILMSYKEIGRGELNLGWKYKFSIVAVYLALLSMPMALFYPVLWFALPLLLMLSLVPHLELMRGFRAKGGTLFAIQCIPLMWFYFTYCGLGFILGLATFYLLRLQGKQLRSDPDKSSPLRQRAQ
jgi:glycosyltransferase involved in cell wall biosynthesis